MTSHQEIGAVRKKKNSPSFSLSFPGAEGEQHRGIPLTKHPSHSPPSSPPLTINPLCSYLENTHTMTKKAPSHSPPLPCLTIKEENPRRERKKTKKEKKNLSWTETDCRSVRLCVSVRVPRLVQSALVRYQLATGGGQYSSRCFCWLFGEGRDRWGGEGLVWYLRLQMCVLGLAVTSCFHTITTNTAHPLTLHHHKKKRRGGGQKGKDAVLISFVLNVPFTCETSRSHCCVLSLWLRMYHPLPPLSLLCLLFSASHPYPHPLPSLHFLSHADSPSPAMDSHFSVQLDCTCIFYFFYSWMGFVVVQQPPRSSLHPLCSLSPISHLLLPPSSLLSLYIRPLLVVSGFRTSGG